MTIEIPFNLSGMWQEVNELAWSTHICEYESTYATERNNCLVHHARIKDYTKIIAVVVYSGNEKSYWIGDEYPEA